MNQLAPIGHNSPPSPIDEINGQYEASRFEAENWADGTPVETEAQMKAVDVLRKDLRAWRLALEAGQKAMTAPLHETYKAALESWKPSIEDAKRFEGCLVAAVDGFKRKLATIKAEEERAARAAAWEKTRVAEEAMRTANAANIEEMRAADAAAEEAARAHEAAKVAAADTVKGMRTATRYEVTDRRALLHWIAANRRDDMTAFLDEWARKNHKANTGADGLRVWQEQEAY